MKKLLTLALIFFLLIAGSSSVSAQVGPTTTPVSPTPYTQAVNVTPVTSNPQPIANPVSPTPYTFPVSTHPSPTLIVHGSPIAIPAFSAILNNVSITSKSANTLTVSQGGNTYTVVSGQFARCITRVSSRYGGVINFADINTGNTIDVYGQWVSGNSNSINACFIRVTTSAFAIGTLTQFTNATVNGTPMNGFTLQTKPHTLAIITVGSQTKYIDRLGNSIQYSDLKVGDHIIASGSLPSSNPNGGISVTIYAQIRNISLPAIIANTTPYSLPPVSNTGTSQGSSTPPINTGTLASPPTSNQPSGCAVTNYYLLAPTSSDPLYSAKLSPIPGLNAVNFAIPAPGKNSEPSEMFVIKNVNGTWDTETCANLTHPWLYFFGEPQTETVETNILIDPDGTGTHDYAIWYNPVQIIKTPTYQLYNLQLGGTSGTQPQRLTNANILLYVNNVSGQEPALVHVNAPMSDPYKSYIVLPFHP